MEISIQISIICAIFAGISAIIALLSFKASREYALKIRRPHTSSPWIMEEGRSVRIFPQNIGGEVASGFNIVTRYPREAKIVGLDAGSFLIKKGGLNNFYVRLEASRVYPGSWLKPISITAKENGQEVPPLEVVSWCKEETGFISLPPLPE